LAAPYSPSATVSYVAIGAISASAALLARHTYCRWWYNREKSGSKEGTPATDKVMFMKGGKALVMWAGALILTPLAIDQLSKYPKPKPSETQTALVEKQSSPQKQLQATKGSDSRKASPTARSYSL
jgi:hypothetical protein